MFQAYEDWNVDTGSPAVFAGRAQIGKGMWPAPIRWRTCSRKDRPPSRRCELRWVPSPTAATLQRRTTTASMSSRVKRSSRSSRRGSARDPRRSARDPDRARPQWSAEEIQAELDNNAQASSDTSSAGSTRRRLLEGARHPRRRLMEDRATCRISSQHMANWLRHGVVTEDQVMETMRRWPRSSIVRMRGPCLRSHGPSVRRHAFRAACDLVLSGVEQPSGYTEPILHARRLERKAAPPLADAERRTLRRHGAWREELDDAFAVRVHQAVEPIGVDMRHDDLADLVAHRVVDADLLHVLRETVVVGVGET